MTTLVTGAAGFLGSHVARQLVARGDNVRVLMRPSSTNRAIADLSLEYVTGDLRDVASLERATKGVKRVFHVAADYRLWARCSKDIYETNVGGTKNLLAAAERAGVEQFIYTSTVATIAVDRPELPNEATNARLDEMIGHYKRSKWLAEQEVLKAAKGGAPIIVAMPTTPVGPWDWKPTPTGKIIVDFLNGKLPGYAVRLLPEDALSRLSQFDNFFRCLFRHSISTPFSPEPPQKLAANSDKPAPNLGEPRQGQELRLYDHE